MYKFAFVLLDEVEGAGIAHLSQSLFFDIFDCARRFLFFFLFVCPACLSRGSIGYFPFSLPLDVSHSPGFTTSRYVSLLLLLCLIFSVSLARGVALAPFLYVSLCPNLVCHLILSRARARACSLSLCLSHSPSLSLSLFPSPSLSSSLSLSLFLSLFLSLWFSFSFSLVRHLSHSSLCSEIHVSMHIYKHRNLLPCFLMHTVANVCRVLACTHKHSFRVWQMNPSGPNT